MKKLLIFLYVKLRAYFVGLILVCLMQLFWIINSISLSADNRALGVESIPIVFITMIILPVLLSVIIHIFGKKFIVKADYYYTLVQVRNKIAIACGQYFWRKDGEVVEFPKLKTLSSVYKIHFKKSVGINCYSFNIFLKIDPDPSEIVDPLKYYQLLLDLKSDSIWKYFEAKINEIIEENWSSITETFTNDFVADVIIDKLKNPCSSLFGKIGLYCDNIAKQQYREI